MDSAGLLELERQFDRLPLEQQLGLIERLVRRVRQAAAEEGAWEGDLARMAADEEVRTELRRIDEEFRPTEGDGLGE
jgi:hypothetical protein